jgi:microcystin-dependent protein
MPIKISETKGFDNVTFDTYVPQLSDNADIQNAFELFYYGDSTDGNTVGDVSLHATIVDLDTRITSATSGISGHTGAISDVHGVGAGNSVVGTGTTQTLTNKTLTSPAITSPTVTGTAVLPATTSIGNVSSTEIGYIDGVTSSIQTQINTNTPTGMISIHSAATAPTGWLLCDGTSYSTTTYANLYGVIGYTFGGSGANFNVPNLKGKVVVGIDAAQAEFDTRGETGGAMTHQHTIAASSAIASNNHDGHGHNTNAHSHGTTVNQNNTGDHNHNTNQITNTGNANALNHNHADTLATGTSSSNLGTPLGSSQNVASSAHSHTVNGNVDSGGVDHDHAITATNIANATNHSHSVGVATNNDSTANAVSGGSHSHTTTVPQHTSDSLSNLQPYMALNYIIKI